MATARLLLGLGLLLMVGALVYGFGWGGGWAEVSALVAYPWFNVSLIDVYVGFGLVCGWILYRERSVPRAAPWILAVLLLGNLVSCLYALQALHRSGGSGPRFWLGRRAPGTVPD